MADVHLTAERRSEFGKGAARRTRRAGLIPAVLYGHGADPQHLGLPEREFTLAVKRGGANVLITLDIDGTEALAIPKAIQRHVIRNTFEHVDLISVRRGEKVTIDVAVVLTGDIAPGGLLQQEHTSVSVEAEATHIPSEFTVSVEGLEIGAQVTAGDLDLPSGVTIAGDATQILVLVSEAPTEAQMEAEMDEAAAELGIEQDAPETPEGESAEDESTDSTGDEEK